MTNTVALDPTVAWLLDGDVAVQYQARRDLLGETDPGLQARIATEGDGAALLAARGPDGHWGRGFYQPKWTSSHYTLLELRGLECPRDTAPAMETAERIVTVELSGSLGLRPGSVARGDACVVGMALDYASWFSAPELLLRPLVDFLLAQEMAGGGFNCQVNRKGATHPALNTTLCVVEGITSYQRAGHGYRLGELLTARAAGFEVLLAHHLFRSHRTGEVIRDDFTRLHHPTRWHYDVLRALDALRDADVAPDERMNDALAVLTAHRRADGRWPVHRGYTGETHVPPPRAGRPNEWITLKALRVLARYPESSIHAQRA